MIIQEKIKKIRSATDDRAYADDEVDELVDDAASTFFNAPSQIDEEGDIWIEREGGHWADEDQLNAFAEYRALKINSKVLNAALLAWEECHEGEVVHIHSDGSATSGTDGATTTPRDDDWGDIVYLFNRGFAKDAWNCFVLIGGDR